MPSKNNKQNPRSKRKTENSQSSSGNSMITPIYKPVHKFHRVVEGLIDISANGITANLQSFVFALSQLPSYTDFTNLYDLYRVVKISVDWAPEYTELTDAALVSNAVNVRFNSAIDITDGNPPVTVDTLLEFESLKSTTITQMHSRSWKPTILMSDLFPCNCWIPTSAPDTRLYCVKVALPPTGVAMTFRSRVRFDIECANVN